MFDKKKKTEKKVEPIQEPVVPQEVEELEEAVVEEPKAALVTAPVDVTKEEELFDKDDVKEQNPIANPSYKAPEVVEELTEEKVVENFTKITEVLGNHDLGLVNHEARIARIEHYLRIDFDKID